jgi:hypothetical protein
MTLVFVNDVDLVGHERTDSVCPDVVERICRKVIDEADIGQSLTRRLRTSSEQKSAHPLFVRLPPVPGSRVERLAVDIHHEP